MDKSYLLIVGKILGIIPWIKVEPGKTYHCSSNGQVQIGNQTVVTVFNGEVSAWEKLNKKNLNMIF